MHIRKKTDILDVSGWKITQAYLITLVVIGGIYLIVRHLWGRYLFITIKQLEGQGFVSEGLEHIWWLFAWSMVIALVSLFVFGQRYDGLLSRKALTVKALWLSINAGVFEEIIYRVLYATRLQWL